MKYVYIVTSGCYSDYSIRAVFSRREDAEALIQEWRDRNEYRARDADVEEWPLDDEVRPDAKHRRISVRLAENGDTIEVTDRHPNGDPIDSVGWWTWREVFAYPRSDAPKRIEFGGCVWARDEDHAVKMARDARAASIAAGDLDRVKLQDPSRFRTMPATHAECREHEDCRDSFELGQACAASPGGA